MFKSYALPWWRLIFPAMLLVTLLAACDNPPAASTPAASTPGASTPGQPQAATTVRPASSLPTNTPNLSTAEGRINSGNTHFQNNEFNEAIADYTEAIAIKPQPIISVPPDNTDRRSDNVLYTGANWPSSDELSARPVGKPPSKVGKKRTSAGA